MGQMAIPLAMMAVASGAQYANTRRVQNKQDATAAQAIQSQAAKQRQLDARVGEEVSRLEGSTAEDERRQRMGEYMDTLMRNRAQMQAGGDVGGQAFRQGAEAASAQVQDYAGKTAGLMARIDAPTMQRQNEGFGFGRLATDASLIAREAQGQSFLDELRMRAIRRNPYLDAIASGAQAAGSAYASYGGGYGNGGQVADTLGSGTGVTTINRGTNMRYVG